MSHEIPPHMCITKARIGVVAVGARWGWGQWTKFTMTSRLPIHPPNTIEPLMKHPKFENLASALVQRMFCKWNLRQNSFPKKMKRNVLVSKPCKTPQKMFWAKLFLKTNVLPSGRYKMPNLIGQTAQYISCLHLSHHPNVFIRIAIYICINCCFFLSANTGFLLVSLSWSAVYRKESF